MLVSNRIVKFTHLHPRDSTPEVVAGVAVPLVLVVAVVAGVCCYLKRRRTLQVHTDSDRRAEYAGQKQKHSEFPAIYQTFFRVS